MYIIQKKGQYTKIHAIPAITWQQRPTYLWQQIKDRLHELWTFRELIQNLVIRDLKVRYKNSLLGIIWSLLNPLFMMVVFTAVFTVMRNQAIEKFPVFVLIGLLPWQFFANSVMGATSSIVANAALINKVYFPREILIISEVLSHLVNFLLAMLVLVPVIILFKISITPWIILLPIMIFIQLIFSLGIGFIVATANVFYRDVRMIMEVLILAGFFLTPVFYSLDILPRSYLLFGVQWDIWRLTYYLNPMASFIANYRVILFYGSPPAFDFLIRTFITAIFFLIVGLTIFYRYNPRFSEEV